MVPPPVRHNVELSKHDRESDSGPPGVPPGGPPGGPAGGFEDSNAGVAHGGRGPASTDDDERPRRSWKLLLLSGVVVAGLIVVGALAAAVNAHCRKREYHLRDFFRGHPGAWSAEARSGFS